MKFHGSIEYSQTWLFWKLYETKVWFPWAVNEVFFFRISGKDDYNAEKLYWYFSWLKWKISCWCAWLPYIRKPFNITAGNSPVWPLELTPNEFYKNNNAWINQNQNCGIHLLKIHKQKHAECYFNEFSSKNDDFHF